MVINYVSIKVAIYSHIPAGDGINIQCFSEVDCGGDSIGLSAGNPVDQRRECCLGDGLSYSVNGQCRDCIGITNAETA